MIQQKLGGFTTRAVKLKKDLLWPYSASLAEGNSKTIFTLEHVAFFVPTRKTIR